MPVETWTRKQPLIGQGGPRVALLLVAVVLTVAFVCSAPNVEVSGPTYVMLGLGVAGALIAIRWPMVGQIIIFAAFIGAALSPDAHAELAYWLMAAGIIDAAVTSPRWMAPTAAGVMIVTVTASTALRQERIYESVANTVLVAAFLVVGLGMRHSMARNEMLRQQLVVARLQENQRIAGRMHDGLALTLSQTLMKLRLLQVEEEFTESQLTELRAMTKDAELAMQQLREATQVLSGSTSEGRGKVSEQVERMANGIRETGFDITLDIDRGIDDAHADVQETVYAVCRESLANVIRHADRQSPVQLEVKTANDYWHVTTTNTIGSDTSRFPSSGHGLRLLKERLAESGSTVEASADGAQWTLTARIANRGQSDGKRESKRRTLRLGG
jgi:signal transduction histidine kinase